MDFELHYTEEQEEFRKEVLTWLETNIPKNFEQPVDPKDTTYEQWQVGREFRRKLGEKGWLTPTVPKEYGGGGLSIAQTIVIAEELAEREEDIPRFFGDQGVFLFVPIILYWGTEEQKQRFLRPMCRGEIVTWQGFTEPNAGSDLASLKTRATRDGDEWVINGEKIFIGAKFDRDYIFTLAVTDPNAPRHHNIGAFMVKADQPGITIIDQNLFPSGEVGVGTSPGKRQIFYDNVRVPAANLIGGETDGWRVTQSTLELEHGAQGAVAPRDRIFERVVAYCQETRRNGQPLIKDPDVRQELLEVYIQNEVGRLWALRNYWMRHTRKRGVAYEGIQAGTILTDQGIPYLRILSPAALTNDPEWGIFGGLMEVFQRNSLLVHTGGGKNIRRVSAARRLGLSRVREVAPVIA